MTHAERRPAGELEAAVLAALWQAAGPLTVPEVQRLLSGTPARTTVATVLARLHGKGTVTRTREGRAFRYRAAVEDHAALAARRMRGELDRATDRSGVLARFAAGLSTRDAAELRALLKGTAR